MKKQPINFVAIKVKSKPVRVKFYTRQEGKLIWLNGFEGIEVVNPEELKAKDLVRWLRKNKFKSLANALSIVIKKCA